MILCILSIFKTTNLVQGCNACVCKHCLLLHWDIAGEMWAGSRQMYSFSSGGKPGLQDTVAPNPKVAATGSRGGAQCLWDWVRWMSRKAGRSRCDPPPPIPPSLCLNKSCSRSFYLYMTTGSSKFPVDGCREEKNRLRKVERLVPFTAAQGLSGFFPGVCVTRCTSDKNLQLQCTSPYSHWNRKAFKIDSNSGKAETCTQ